MTYDLKIKGFTSKTFGKISENCHILPIYSILMKSRDLGQNSRREIEIKGARDPGISRSRESREEALNLGFTKESEQYWQRPEKVANVKKTRFCNECRTFEAKDFAL